MTVITAHHEWWIDFDNSTAQKQNLWRFEALPRFEALWKQIGEYFQSYRQLLVFSILNEPAFLTPGNLNELHRVALIAIRHTNPSRIVTISGMDCADPRWLLKNPTVLTIPRDPQLLLEIHVTEPHAFAGTRPVRKEWGNLSTDEGVADYARIKDWVDQIELFGRARNLPIYVAEFGCSNEQTSESGRVKWIEANWKEMRRKGFCASLFDDGERFTVYDRKAGKWDEDVLVALQRSLPGLKGVSIHRTGGGLGGDSDDPTVDLQRRLELCFSRLTIALDDCSKLPELAEHEYKEELGRRERADSDDEDDD